MNPNQNDPAQNQPTATPAAPAAGTPPSAPATPTPAATDPAPASTPAVAQKSGKKMMIWVALAVVVVLALAAYFLM
jgi:uncharacterized protein HemX